MIPKEPLQASQEFIQDLRQAVPDSRFDRMSRLLYSTDASIYQMVPIGVAMPRDTDEVRAAVEIAGKHGVPVLPRGGGSSLAGQAVGHALVLDLSLHLNRMLEIAPEIRQLRAQPGLTLGDLNRQLSPHGLMFGPDPASADRATMGGILGNNSTGAHSIVYGMSLDHIRESKVVLGDGSLVQFDSFTPTDWNERAHRPGREGDLYRELSGILERYAGSIATRYPRTFRHVAGYNLNRLAGSPQPNLTQLMVGSEGTLGVVTEMTLNLVPIPPVKRLAMVHFNDLRRAMEAVTSILESQPSAIEVLDKLLLDLTRDKIEYRRLLTFVHGEPEVILLVEYAGQTELELEAGIERLRRLLDRSNHKEPVVIVQEPGEQANVWYVRKVGLGILMSIRGDAKPIPFIEDAAVPVEHLADYVTEIYAFCREAGVDQVAMYAHASAGCLHIRPLVNLKVPQGLRQLRAIAEKSVELVIAYGGTTSGEHGEGLVRAEFSERLFGPELVQAFREVKAAFDPEGRMNPGKLVDPPSMDDESLLRFGSDYTLPLEPSPTRFNFTKDGGFSRAVEMCNGAGVCRKVGEGVMCPSFQVTREEADSTRGRANALRAAMMGLLGPEGLASEELYQVLDLCLGCQACKSECPSAVDMARLKSEFLYHHHQTHGVPLRDRIFGNIASLNRLAQPLAPVANWMLNGPGKWAMSTLGVHPARELPRFATKTFTQRVKQRTPAPARDKPSAGRSVVFFHDTFLEHHHPEIGVAALQILETAGCRPILLKDKRCCGRPAVSKGLLGEARQLAEHNLELLYPYAQKGIPIVGCEPSCVVMLTDEYPDLAGGQKAHVVAKQAMLLETFLMQEIESKRLTLSIPEQTIRILFQGHCQQKANYGTQDSLALLRLIPGSQVEEVDSGCCGMAGSFGYEHEHYEFSIRLAELALAPAIRAAGEATLICATGTSCREQILHTTGRSALHPIEVLALALGNARVDLGGEQDIFP